MLDAANDLFAERGYEEVSVEDIARAAGVTRGLVHHYFGGRTEVYIALLERLDAMREGSLRQPEGRSARARVADTVSRWLDWTEANRLIYLGTIAPGEDIADPEVRRVVADLRGRAVALLATFHADIAQTTRLGCATHWSAGPASTAPRHGGGYAATPPARQHRRCSPPRSNTSCAPSARSPRPAELRRERLPAAAAKVACLVADLRVTHDQHGAGADAGLWSARSARHPPGPDLRPHTVPRTDVREAATTTRPGRRHPAVPRRPCRTARSRGTGARATEVSTRT